jgi:hypothetical protein
LRRRYLAPLIALVLPLLLPAVTWAATTPANEKAAAATADFVDVFIVLAPDAAGAATGAGQTAPVPASTLPDAPNQAAPNQAAEPSTAPVQQ